MTFMERLERLAEFANATGKLKNGLEYMIRTGEHLEAKKLTRAVNGELIPGPGLSDGITKHVMLRHPKTGSRISYSHQPASPLSPLPKAKRNVEIGNLESGASDADPTTKAGKMKRARATIGLKKVGEQAFDHLHKNKRSVGYIPLAMTEITGAGVASTDAKLGKSYDSMAKRTGKWNVHHGPLGTDGHRSQLTPK
jgi:hypothetical protein